MEPSLTRRKIRVKSVFHIIEILGEMEENGPRQNTAFTRNMTLMLFLSRLLVLKYCMQVPGCCQSFLSASWAILQVCPHMFQDVFMELFRKLYDQMKERSILVSVMESVVRDELLSVRETLATHAYPQFLKRDQIAAGHRRSLDS